MRRITSALNALRRGEVRSTLSRLRNLLGAYCVTLLTWQLARIVLLFVFISPFLETHMCRTSPGNMHTLYLARMPYATAIQSLRAYEHTYHQLCGSRRNHHPPHLEYLVGTHCSIPFLGRLLHVEHRLASQDIKTTYNNKNCWHTQRILVTIDINTKQSPSTTPQEP